MGPILTQKFILCGYGQSSLPISLRVNLTHGHAKSNQGLTRTEECTQTTQGTLLEHLVQVIRKTMSLGYTGHLINKATQPRLRDSKST